VQAADSTSRWGNLCKIFAGPDCIVALTGVVANKSIHFDLDGLAAEACRESGSLRQKVDLFSKIAGGVAVKLVGHTSERTRGFAYIRKSTVVFYAVFAGRQDGHLVLFVRDYRVFSHDDFVKTIALEAHEMFFRFVQRGFPDQSPRVYLAVRMEIWYKLYIVEATRRSANRRI